MSVRCPKRETYRDETSAIEWPTETKERMERVDGCGVFEVRAALGADQRR